MEQDNTIIPVVAVFKALVFVIEAMAAGTWLQSELVVGVKVEVTAAALKVL